MSFSSRNGFGHFSLSYDLNKLIRATSYKESRSAVMFMFKGRHEGRQALTVYFELYFHVHKVKSAAQLHEH